MATAAAAAAIARAARLSLRRPQHNHLSIGRYFAAQSQSPSEPAKTYSENEFPEREEPPVISRTNAADVAAKTALLPRSTATMPNEISPERRIGTERPAHIPPNLPFDSLGTPRTEITTLPNGVRVGSMENYSQVSSVGVVLDFGSRHEVDGAVSTAGVNHLMELLAFQSTQNHTGEEIRNIMENLGGASFATSSREQMMYCVDVLRPNVKEAFNLMAETIQSPVIEETEVEEMKQVVEFQLMEAMPEILMGEGLQMAGYGPLDGGSELQQLGRPHFCTAGALPRLTAHSVHTFREQHLLHKPEGIVVSGTGISHNDLVELAEANFGHIAPTRANDSGSRDIPSVYTGGDYRLQTPPSPNPAKEEYTHVAIGFEVGGWHSPDLVPACVLQTLLGGGSSFSAGGPGKGMYSRLYREVLNRNRWVESSQAFASFHAESGLWGIQGSSDSSTSRELTIVTVDQLLKLKDSLVEDEELDRARNMLKCNLLTQLESRLILFEDIGRQILTYGKREDAATMCAKIDAVTKEDIREVVRKAMQKPPTLSAVGIDIKNVPRVEEVTQWLEQGLPPKKWF